MSYYRFIVLISVLGIIIKSTCSSPTDDPTDVQAEVISTDGSTGNQAKINSLKRRNADTVGVQVNVYNTVNNVEEDDDSDYFLWDEEHKQSSDNDVASTSRD